MKKILLLATGGTIASKPTASGGLAPAITSEELLSFVPELAKLCEIDAVQLFSLDSTNVGPEQWQQLVHAIRQTYDAYDGFVIAHGTDTMAYTAAALRPCGCLPRRSSGTLYKTTKNTPPGLYAMHSPGGVLCIRNRFYNEERGCKLSRSAGRSCGWTDRGCR